MTSKKEAESIGTGYRITQIILSLRSIPQELFAARHKSALLTPTQLMSLSRRSHMRAFSGCRKSICTETPAVFSDHEGWGMWGQ